MVLTELPAYRSTIVSPLLMLFHYFLYIITLQCPLAPPGAPGTDTQTSWTTFSEIINLI